MDYVFTYNVRNRPVSVTRNSAAWATYAYNALEQMVSRSTSAPGGPVGTVQYVYDLSGHLIAEADGATGATLREYIWLAANDNQGTSELPLATVTNVNTTPVLYMVHADHLGRPLRMTDSSKATVWQATYKPFGEVQSTSGTISNDLRFPGQFFEIETGLAYNWHRHYDPLTGRYTQPDPLRFVDGPSVFAYAGGSPFGFVDRNGQAMGAGDIFLGAALSAAVDAASQYYTTGCVHLSQVGVAALSGAIGGGISYGFGMLTGSESFWARYGSQAFLNSVAGGLIGEGSHGLNNYLNRYKNGNESGDEGDTNLPHGISGGSGSNLGQDAGWGAGAGLGGVVVSAAFNSLGMNGKIASATAGAVIGAAGGFTSDSSVPHGCSCKDQLGGLSWLAW